MSSFVRVPLAAAVAALTLTGCNIPQRCDCKETAAVEGKTKGGGGSTKASTTTTTETKVTKTVVSRAHRPGRRERVEGGYRYRESGYSGGYAGTSVEVSETETSSSRYRYSESEERYGSRGGGYAYAAGETSSGGYGYAGGSASGGYAQTGGPLYAPPPPTAGTPAVYRPPHRLSDKDEYGYLTWPGKVE